MSHELPKLGFEYDALEPHIDAETMEIHHSKHHAAYVAKLNTALENHSDLAGKSVDELIRNLDELPESIRTAVRNNGGGHLNHTFFWRILKSKVDFKGEIAEAINAKFGDFDKFKEEFSKTALGVFGSGWAWLVVDKSGELQLMGTSNQDSPLTCGCTPLFCVDVWEHAYYLKYQNRRPDYVTAIFNVLNWDTINEFYLKTRQTAKAQ